MELSRPLLLLALLTVASARSTKVADPEYRSEVHLVGAWEREEKSPEVVNVEVESVEIISDDGYYYATPRPPPSHVTETYYSYDRYQPQNVRPVYAANVHSNVRPVTYKRRLSTYPTPAEYYAGTEEFLKGHPHRPALIGHAAIWTVLIILFLVIVATGCVAAVIWQWKKNRERRLQETAAHSSVTNYSHSYERV